MKYVINLVIVFGVLFGIVKYAMLMDFVNHKGGFGEPYDTIIMVGPFVLGIAGVTIIATHEAAKKKFVKR